MRRASLEREVLLKRRRRSRRTRPPQRPACTIAISLINTGLGDRIMMEAPLRLHRRNHPDDRLIAILDRGWIVDLPYAVRRHFDEIWWLSSGNGKRWNSSPRSAAARRVREALIAEQVDRVYVPWWGPIQFPRNHTYTLRRHNCIAEGNYLRALGFLPRVVVSRAARRWADDFLRQTIPGHYEVLVSVHVRKYWELVEKNLDPRLIEQILALVRLHGRFAFLLIGREDGPPGIEAPDVFSFVGRKWSFEQTAAVMARTGLFIGGDSGPTHAAAALGIPVISFGRYGEHVRPFTRPSRCLYFQMGDSPETIMAEVKRFVQRLAPRLGQRGKSWRTTSRKRRAKKC